jgi:hypothetical protein
MTGQIVTRADGSALDPSGCGMCGINERGHFERWASGPGWHRWTEPTSEQRLERMLARRAARNTTPETTQVLADATTRTHHNIPKEGLMTNIQPTDGAVA